MVTIYEKILDGLNSMLSESFERRGEVHGDRKKDSFPAEDGHIESILIGVDQVKVSFQTWDSRKLIFIFDNVDIIISSHSVYGDISGFKSYFW